MPVGLVGVYVLALLPELGILVNHTWWSADSASGGVIAELYHQPPPGQYILIGDHGWYEELAFYLLTRGLPAHRLLWYLTPCVFWALTIALVGLAAARAFGRYGSALAVSGLLLLAPAGLLIVFESTSHNNVVFHSALLGTVVVWLLPRIRRTSLPSLAGIAAAVGAFSGLAVAGDMLALGWLLVPFVAAVALCCWRGPAAALRRTIMFGALTLVAMVTVVELLTHAMHSVGFRIDARAGPRSFVEPSNLLPAIGPMLDKLTWLVGGAFFGRQLDSRGILDGVSGGLLILALIGVLVAGRRAVSAVGQTAVAGGVVSQHRAVQEVTPRLVYVTYWLTCLIAGMLMIVLSSLRQGDVRYMVGPLVAVGALLPLAASGGFGWRVAIAGGLTVMALAGLARIATERPPNLPVVKPLSSAELAGVERFARRNHVSDGFAIYWDAATITWYTRLRVDLHEIVRCGPNTYCPRYQEDSFTASYLPRAHLRTMFISDRRFGIYGPAPSWGKPVASARIGRLHLYAYSYDIASRFGSTPGKLRRVLTGK